MKCGYIRQTWDCGNTREVEEKHTGRYGARADAAKIDAAISPAFFNVTFTDPGSNSRITKRCYSNTPSYPVYSYVDGVKTYKGVGATLIGK